MKQIIARTLTSLMVLVMGCRSRLKRSPHRSSRLRFRSNSPLASTPFPLGLFYRAASSAPSRVKRLAGTGNCPNFHRGHRLS
jgi:hypothetical protein